MRLSDLQKKDVVNLDDGKKMGKIMDAEISFSGEVIHFVVLNYSFWQFWRKNDEVLVTFKQIKKIGEDVILVKISYHE